MPRPLRLEYPDAIYHVTTRGIQQAAIFLDDQDRASLLSILARALKECDARAFGYCLMGNHYHLILQTRQPNLSVLMRRINSVYSLTFNRRHSRCGHVFEGRYKALHVDRDAYLLAVCRYVDLNPVRAGLVALPGQWNWSSYRAHTGSVPAPPWLATEEVHGAFQEWLPQGPADPASACRRYADWVEAGRHVQLWKESLRRGLYLGDEGFVERVERVTS
ncbi:MAG: transposase [Burkholderiales bacterium]|nr:transposase [Burkholderiales bacterium]